VFSLLESVCHCQPDAWRGRDGPEKQGTCRPSGEFAQGSFRRRGIAGRGRARCAGLLARLETERSLRIAAEQRVAELERKLAELEKDRGYGGFHRRAVRGRIPAADHPAERAGYIRLGERLDRAGRAAILAELSSRRPLEIFSELSAAPGAACRWRRFPAAAAAFEGFPEDPEHDEALKMMAAEPGLAFDEAIHRVRLAGTVS